MPPEEQAPQKKATATVVKECAGRSVAAAQAMASTSAAQRSEALLKIAQELKAAADEVLAANEVDVRAATAGALSKALIDRLLLTPARYAAMAEGVRELAGLPDPAGQLISSSKRPNGLLVKKVRVPIGVVAMIYEARPNVTVDAAALCIRTSNAVILRGGTEALSSNRVLVAIVRRALLESGLPQDLVQLLPSQDYSAVDELVKLEGVIDVVIPRGGESLIRAVVAASRVPVLKHYKGVCHCYVDGSADIEMALAVCENAKCQRPGVCNATETLLVHRDIAARFLPLAAERLRARGVELRGDEESRRLVSDMKEATEADWSAEYLDLILSVKVVPGVEAAVQHINKYGSRHTDAVLARSSDVQDYFATNVDASVVCVNASTRFNDGGEFGLGAELGISTDKLHARGPVGAEELTTYKYVVVGDGHIRS